MTNKLLCVMHNSQAQTLLNTFISEKPMHFHSFDPQEVEQAIKDFWNEINLTEQLNNQGDEPFYFLDGPPYTSGQVHIGTAWNKSMKDLVVRYNRMRGKNVYTRAGYDMHGLPNEHATMKELGLENNQDIKEYGLEAFAKACKQRALRNLEAMNKEFENMGVSLDFTNAYQTMSDEWIESVWWLIKQAHTKNRLYEGQRPMAWDPVSESACAKHELEYKSVQDTSIYVKFHIPSTDEYLIVWTTTPWTIPFNLMIMVNPELTYQKLSVGEETWIVAKDLREELLEAAQKEGLVEEELLGEELVGLEYEHFFADELDYQSIKQAHPNTHTVVASKEYVTTEAGTGLVHAAPGCGPEDYEVGVEYDVPAWNLLDAKGCYPENAGVFSGVRAREEDHVFTEEITARNALVAAQDYVHDYPHAERTKAAVVYKATKQWFFKIDDLKEQMVSQNNEVHWTPQAGYNAFNNWLENLRDNSITKQRFWGTPFPVWRSEEGDILVVESKKELEALSGQTITHLHKPWIDKITITQDGKTYKRLPDVLDVWIDAGVAHFAALGYPQDEKTLKNYWPADFIIEGNDQIRGWFNLLMVTSAIAFGKAPFKNVYMHGMINDTKGRKMSKSEGNYIVPEEIIDKYGADASRLYLISASRAGQDLNYNHADCENKHKNLLVYWNIHKYLLDLIQTTNCTPTNLQETPLGVEEKYLLSKTHRALKQSHHAMSEYRLERVPQATEELLDTISRTYIQLVRTKAHTGSQQEQQAVINVLSHAYLVATKLLAPVAPFFTEAIWQNLKEPLGLAEESIHLATLPDAQETHLNESLEQDFLEAQQLISTLLSARDKAQIGVRWPLAQARITGINKPSNELEALIKEQTNLQELLYEEQLPLTTQVAPNYRAIGKEHGEATAEIAQAINDDPEGLGEALEATGSATAAGHTLTKEYFEVTRSAPEGYVLAEDDELRVLLDTTQDEKLLAEGYRRELIRRIQHARKEADMDKTDEITLVLAKELQELVDGQEQEIATIVGATTITYGAYTKHPHVTTDTIKEQEIAFGFSKTNA